MRQGIDYIGTGTGAFIINDMNELLLVKRGMSAKNERGHWQILGGAVEFGDTLEETIKREVNEEIGVEIEVVGMLPIKDHILSDEKQHWVTQSFVCKIKSGEPTIREPHKHEQIGWFAFDNLPSPLSPITKIDVERYLEKKVIKLNS